MLLRRTHAFAHARSVACEVHLKFDVSGETVLVTGGGRSLRVLGHAPMDAIHAEFDDCVAQALACTDADLHAVLLRLHRHLIHHFGEEDAWMRHTAFPAADCHIEEHGNVLASAVEVLALVAQGHLEIGRSFASELHQWFPGHADYLDSALAAWLCKRQYGGKPIVLHARRSPPRVTT